MTEEYFQFVHKKNNCGPMLLTKEKKEVNSMAQLKSEYENEFAAETTKTGVIKCNSSQVDISILESQYFLC